MKKYLLFLPLIVLVGCGPKYKNVPLVDFPIHTENTQGVLEEKLSFAIVKPAVKLKGIMGKTYHLATSNRLIRELEYAQDAINDEMQKIVIKKGITVQNTYSKIDDMTYSQKKNTTGVLMPEIVIYLNESGNSFVNQYGYATSSNSIINAKIKINLLVIEPLSNERVWIRTLPNISENIRVVYNIPSGIIASSPTVIVEDLVMAVNEFDKLILSIYNSTLNSIDKYVSLEEFQNLNSDIEKLKGIKRY